MSAAFGNAAMPAALRQTSAQPSAESSVTVARPRREQVQCSVEIAHTADDFYAHVVLDGVEVGPGDEVLVHNAPTSIGWGEHCVCDTSATVLRASRLGRWWTRLTARFELTMLYEVSFSTARFAHSGRKPYPRRPLVRAAGDRPGQQP